jgi:serine/threonine-protein kinase
MMYEMTTRTLPFDADNTIGLIAQHIHASIVPPQDKRADLPVYLNDLIVKMMSKTPQERPPSASAVLQVLEKPSRPEVRKNTSSP